MAGVTIPVFRKVRELNSLPKVTVTVSAGICDWDLLASKQRWTYYHLHFTGPKIEAQKASYFLHNIQHPYFSSVSSLQGTTHCLAS